MKADGTSPLTAAHGAIIAGAMEELSEADPHSDAIDVDPSRVVVRKLPKAASRYKITLIDQDVMGRVFPYWNRDTSPKSITTPAPIGYTAEGQLYSRALRKHSSDVGESTSGKTSLIQVEWAWTTLCEDEVDWIVGTEKVYDGVGAWLEPYRGRDEPVPFDLIAVGPEDATLTIAMGIALARWRQAQDFAVRETFKTVIIRLDEATGLLTHPHAFAVYDGALMDASALAAHGTNGTAGGGGKVYFKLAAQRGTQDRWGKSGGSINANISDQTVFRSGEQSELGRAFNDWKLPMPDRPGMCWINSGDNDLQLIKSMYIQSVDADQPVLHDGPNLSQVAAGRSHIAKGLDKASAEFLGEWYANRRTRADDLIPYVKAITSDLQGVDPYQTAKGIGAPAAGGKSGQATAASNTAHEQSTTAAPIKAPPGVDMNNPLIAQAAREVAAEMEQVDREFGLTGEQQPELEQAPPPTMTPTFVTPGPPPKTREQKVLAIVRDAEEPPGRAAILQRLRDDYGDDKASPQLVTNALNALVSKQIIARNDDTNTYIVEGTTA